MLKNKKAFTLIELLAVIVILAIIALIATPIILGIVEDARKDSFLRSVELVIKTTDIDIFSKNYTNTYTYTITDGNISNLEVGVKNTDGMNGSIIYDKNGNDIYAIHNGKYCVIKEAGMKKAEIKDYVEDECELVIPTDLKYFSYIEILKDFRIVDKDVCVDFFVSEKSYPNDVATTVCNNESHIWSSGMTLTDYAKKYPTDRDIIELIEAGILDGTPTNTMAIIGYSEEGPKDVVIPSSIDGKNVIRIGESAFWEDYLTSVVIPNTVFYIDNSAFEQNSLQEITIPENIEIISSSAFSDNLLREIMIPKNVKSIESSAFSDNSIQIVIIENDDIEISDWVFCNNPIVENVNSEFYQKVYDINSEAFECQGVVG